MSQPRMQRKSKEKIRKHYEISECLDTSPGWGRGCVELGGAGGRPGRLPSHGEGHTACGCQAPSRSFLRVPAPWWALAPAVYFLRATDTAEGAGLGAGGVQSRGQGQALRWQNREDGE